MILSDNEVITRLNSPLNLINRLRSNSKQNNGMELFIPSRNPDEPQLTDESVAAILDSIKDVEEKDELDEILPDNAAKIKLGIVKAQAIDVLHDSILELGRRLPEVAKVRDLSSIARDMKEIIAEKEDVSKQGNNQVVIYKPVINDISKYETLVVTE